MRGKYEVRTSLAIEARPVVLTTDQTKVDMFSTTVSETPERSREEYAYKSNDQTTEQKDKSLMGHIITKWFN